MKKLLTLPYLKWIFWVGITFAWGFIFVEGYNGETLNWGMITHETGSLAWNLLMFTIFISLLQKLFPKISLFARLLPLRKHTGIFAFLVALSHVVASFFDFGGNWDKAIEITFGNLTFTFGTIAFLAMLPAFVTSTNWAVRKMGGKCWKNVQRLAHIAFIFTVLHLGFLHYSHQGEIDYGSFVPLVIYVIGYGVVFFRKKRPA